MTYSFQLALIAGIFVATVVIVNRGVPLPYAVNLCAALIALTARVSLTQFIGIVGQVLIDPRTIELLVAVVLIRWLGDIMNRSGSLTRSSDLLQQVVGDLRVVASIIPLLIGLLMVPGGAILSAPTVEQLTDDMGLRPSRQAGVNLIFRHVGQIFFPMSASLLMLTSIVGVNLARQALYQLPIGIAIGLFSFYYYFSAVEKQTGRGTDNTDNPERFRQFGALLKELSPILVTIIIFAITQKIAWGLALGTIWALWLYRFSAKEAMSSFQLKASLESMLLIIGTLIIRGILQNEVITEAAFAPMLQLSFAPLLMCFLPWIIGFFTGSVLAAVSLAAPLLLPLLIHHPNGYLFCTAIFMASFGGYLISPIHLCLSLTAEYYEARLGEVYQDIWLPAVTFLLSAIVASLLLILC